MLIIVTGPPCSGKSTYVRQHSLPGDIVIDFDLLAQTFGSEVTHGHSRDIQKVTVAAVSAATTEAIKRHLHGAKVWIVDTSLTPSRLAQYRRASAKIVRLKVDRETLHKRAEAERPAFWHKLIDDWRAVSCRSA